MTRYMWLSVLSSRACSEGLDVAAKRHISKTLLFLVALCIGACFSSCGGGGGDSSSIQSVDSSALRSLRDEYLSALAEVDEDAFVSEQAALGYLKNYCEALQLGNPATEDKIDKIVASYCGTSLADEVGVQTTVTLNAVVDFDEKSFRVEALERFGVGEVYEDGSQLDAISSAQSICNSDIDEIVRNLGEDFVGSYQEFAITNLCPEKLTK
jgi:hypothetical protein